MKEFLSIGFGGQIKFLSIGFGGMIEFLITEFDGLKEFMTSLVVDIIKNTEHY